MSKFHTNFLWSSKLCLASTDILSTVSECWILLVIKLFPQKSKRKKSFFKKGGGGKDGMK